MKLLVVSTAPILKSDLGIVAYAPLVAELDLWFKTAEQITIIAPTKYNKPLLTAPFARQDIKVIRVPALHFSSPVGLIKSVWGTAITKVKLLAAMASADHIHLRCPGNTSMLGCYMQILFPRTPKTAKYAGNWNPKAKQPISYKYQKWLLKNTVLTKNMQVLVYGDWPNQTKNIKSFFTASYLESEVEPLKERVYNGNLKALFVGSLSPGKRPLYALELVKQLRDSGINISLDFYGDGAERAQIEAQIKADSCESYVRLLGNQPREQVKEAYKTAHFLVLPSKSEGWPKAVAEAMFWGCIPWATPISCVPWMLASGNRGVLLNLESDVEQLKRILKNQSTLQKMAAAGAEWSRAYTVERFDQEIQKLLGS